MAAAAASENLYADEHLNYSHRSPKTCARGIGGATRRGGQGIRGRLKGEQCAHFGFLMRIAPAYWWHSAHPAIAAPASTGGHAAVQSTILLAS